MYINSRRNEFVVSTQRWDGLHALKVYVDESQNVEQGSGGWDSELPMQGAPGSTPGQGTGSHIPQVRDPVLQLRPKTGEIN